MANDTTDHDPSRAYLGGVPDLPFSSQADEACRATAQWFQSDPDYRPPNQDRDLLSSAPAPFTIDLILGRSNDINKRSPSNLQPLAPKPEKLPLYQYWNAYGYRWTSPVSGRDYFPAQQEPTILPVTRSQKVALDWQITPASCLTGAVQDGINSYTSPLYQHQSKVQPPQPRDVVLTGATRPPTKSKNEKCFECYFTHKACLSSIPNSPCDRCTRRYRDMIAASLRPSNGLEDASFSHILTVVAFDIRSTQILLTSLRGASEAVTNLQPGVTLEDYFKGSIVCHMDHSAFTRAGFSVTGVPVAVKHLATTRKALTFAEASNQAFPLPGLDDRQMDRFIDVANRMCKLGKLPPDEQAIIVTALRCSDYLGILRHWDNNAICFEGLDSIPPAKNLVLETAYAIAYRIQQLLKILCHEVNQSLLRKNDSDPATISCALRIVYQAIDCFRKSAWSAKSKWSTGSLRDLKTFLVGLQDRAPAALQALERHRVTIGFIRCGKASKNVKAFQALIDAKKSPKSAITFTYQQYYPSDPLLFTSKTYRQQSYTEVLEASMVNWDSFEFDTFDPVDYNRIEFRTLENAQTPSATVATSTFTLAELRERDKVFTSKSYAGSIDSVSCETGSAFGTESDDDQEHTTVPSLTMGETIPEESRLSLDTDIRLTELRLEHLRKVKSGAFLLDDMHEDWPEHMDPQGPPIHIENQSLISKFLSRVGSFASVTGTKGRKRTRRHQKSLKPLPEVYTSLGSKSTNSATKRMRLGQPYPDPASLPETNYATNASKTTGLSFGKIHDLDVDFYDTTDQVFPAKNGLGSKRQMEL